MLNRTEQPSLKPIESIDFIAPKKYEISDSVPLYHMKDVPNDTARFDFYFDAGRCRGEGGIPGFVNGLLLSGTATKTSIQIEQEINELGGFYESGLSVENSVVSMYCLREYLPSIYKILVDAISGVAFIEKEVNELISDRKQKWRIDQEKVGTLAQAEFRERLFASNLAYGTSVKEEDFNDVSIDQLKAFHREHYLQGLTKVVIVADLEEDVILDLVRNIQHLAAPKVGGFDDTIQNTPGTHLQDKAGAIQTAIRAGRMLFNKNHPDYLDFLILNTILGDYFGSRLMANIREDKGYTYGIGTMVAELFETGYFMISTEVGKDVRDATLQEIQYEMDLLRTELVSADELQLVQNYMLGQLLKSADGPHAMTDLFLSAEAHGQTLDFYNKALASIQNITAERIHELAKKYLKWEDFSVVAVG